MWRAAWVFQDDEKLLEAVVASGDPGDAFELRVHHVPGHTIGHICLEDAEARTLVTGDHVMGGAVPSTTSYYVDPRPTQATPERRERFKGLPAYLKSLRRLKGLGSKTILPAHGGVLRNARRAIDEALSHAAPVERCFDFGDDAGRAAAAKLTGNFMIAGAIEALAEGLDLAEGQGRRGNQPVSAICADGVEEAP